MKHPSENFKLAVIKAGTDILKGPHGKLSRTRTGAIMEQCVMMRNYFDEVYLVSSGAVQMGAERLGIKISPDLSPDDRKFLASRGQHYLLEMYSKYLGDRDGERFDLDQIMVDKDGFLPNSALEGTMMKNRSAQQRVNGKSIPIFNWNDPLHDEEVTSPFGNNDNLAYELAMKFNANVLVLLTNVNGVRREEKKPSTLIHEINVDTYHRLYDCVRVSEQEKSLGGTGGMTPKYEAAANFACAYRRGDAFIGGMKEDGTTMEERVLERMLIEREAIGTIFRPDNYILT